MEPLNSTTEFNLYNTAIKDIAGLKDYTVLFDIIKIQFSGHTSASQLIHDLNALHIRTLKTRTKVEWAINKAIFQFYNRHHQNLMQSVFSKEITSQDKKFVFIWHLSLTNRLFREVTTLIFSKVYFSGRATISQDDIIPFIKEIKDKDLKILWSDNTIYRLATKYLSLMTKLEFITTGRRKSFNHIRPSSEAQVLFLYFAKLFSPNASNILANELLPVSFIPSEDIQDRLKKLSLKGFFNMNFNGVALNIELTHSYKGICDALYN